MKARMFILTQIHECCRALDRLFLSCRVPYWEDIQYVRACVLRLERADDSAWPEFLERLRCDRRLADAVRRMLVERGIVEEAQHSNRLQFTLPSEVAPLSTREEKEFLQLLDLRRRGKAVFATCGLPIDPANPCTYSVQDEMRFIMPANESAGEIMYIEMKPGLAGPARIGRVRFSKTRKTLYYGDIQLQSLKGSGFKANYYNVKSGMQYWISRCRQDGSDALYPGVVEIDEDVREEYWTEVRQQPENKHLTRFRSPGKYTRRGRT